MNSRIFLPGVLLSCLLAGCARTTASIPMTAVEPPAISIPVGNFHGSPAELGWQHGTEFRLPIHYLFENYLLLQVPPSQRVWARMAAANFLTVMPAEYRLEIQALAQATGLNLYDAALGQCFLDLTSVMGCSTIALPAEASPDGVARFGRNLDFTSGGILDKESVLLVYHPNGRYAFAAIGWPGMIGVVSGMNQYGLTLACMEVPRQARPPTAMPYTLLYRTILEQCRTVDQAIDLLKRTPRQTPNNLMLMDAAGDRAVAEIKVDSVTVRRAKNGASLISTNHQRGEDTDTPGLCWRYDSLHAESAGEFGKIDLKAIESMLAHVVQGNKGDMTLQSMVFEPANRVIYLATGADAPNHPFERIDLKPFFAAE